jgi:putative lipoprotein
MKRLGMLAVVVTVLACGAYAAPQSTPYLGRFVGEESVAGGRTNTVALLIRERGEATVRTAPQGRGEPTVENARWSAEGGGNRFLVTTEKGERFEVEYQRNDSLRVTRIDPTSGRRFAPFNAYKVQIDPFLGRYEGSFRGAGGPVEVVLNIKSEDDVSIRFTYPRGGSEPVVEQARLEGAGKPGRVRLIVGPGDEYLLERRSTDSLTVTNVQGGQRFTPFVVTRADQQAWEGVYISGPGVRSFRACRSKEVYVVEGDRAALDQLDSEYRRVAKRSYEPVYVSLRGELTGSAPASIRSDYDGSFRVAQVATMRTRAAGDCAGASNPAYVTGTVTYRERIALPRGAVVEVRLLDPSRQDEAARVVAEQTIRNVSSVPVRYSVQYDPLEINERRRYTLEARIVADGRTLFATATGVPVVTQGGPRTLDLVLVAMGRVDGGPLTLAGDGRGTFDIGGRQRSQLVGASITVRADGSAELVLRRTLVGPLAFAGRVVRRDASSLEIRLSSSGNASAGGDLEVSYDVGGGINSIAGSGTIDGQRFTVNFFK